MLGKPNRIRQLIGQGKTARGIVCRTLSPVVVELIGLAGFDCVWIDMEHSSADFTTVESLCRAAEATGLTTLVRVPDKNPASILKALEAGAEIVNVPLIETREEAEAVVKAAKYFPEGQRGFCSSSRGNSYGLRGKTTEIFAATNDRVMTMVQIESPRGVENAGEICSVSGLDIVFVGLGDLSQAVGLTGQLDHPDLLDSARRVLNAVTAQGKMAAMQADTIESMRRWMDEGVRLFFCGVDVTVIGRGFLRIREELACGGQQ